MKTRFLIILGILAFSFIVPQAFSDNEFCNIQENLKIQEELVKDNVVLIEFLKLFPNAKLIRANFVDESNPEQTSMTWIAGMYSLDMHIWGFDKNNPSDCFFPGGYRLNAPHLPKMAGLEYHKDPTIVLGQIDELEPKYVKGGPPPPLDTEIIFPKPSPFSITSVGEKITIQKTFSNPFPGNVTQIELRFFLLDGKKENPILLGQVYGNLTSDSMTYGHKHTTEKTGRFFASVELIHLDDERFNETISRGFTVVEKLPKALDSGRCSGDLEILFRPDYRSLACVTDESKPKLVSRGWIIR